jgi:hypothetical protein
MLAMGDHGVPLTLKADFHFECRGNGLLLNPLDHEEWRDR